MFPIGLRSIQARHRFPRVRGDVPRTAWEAASTAWFSPHARGCSQRLSHLHQGRNVFPACAGMFLSVPDHRFLCYCFPRVRGDVPLWFTAQTGMAAFSPRARGCSRDALIRELAASVFPACAGMFPRAAARPERQTCFPRVRGDVPGSMMRSGLGRWFSPRARGCS